MTHVIAQAAQAHMEIFGIGPEMLADRGKAWVEALAVVLETLIAKIGVLILAALALRKTILSNAKLEERMDRQGQRIDAVALAVPAATNGNGKPPAVNIESASVQIQPDSAADHPDT